MEKLKRGDYVENLTESQFNRLTEIFNAKYLTYDFSKIPALDYKSQCLVFGGIFIGHAHKNECVNLLSYKEFLERALYTRGISYKKEDFPLSTNPFDF